jgi:hypothetical protein
MVLKTPLTLLLCRGYGSNGERGNLYIAHIKLSFSSRLFSTILKGKEAANTAL